MLASVRRLIMLSVSKTGISVSDAIGQSIPVGTESASQKVLPACFDQPDSRSDGGAILLKACGYEDGVG